MTQQIIDVGTSPNDGQGDPLRTAFTKTNENFTDLYNTTVTYDVGEFSSGIDTPTTGTWLAADGYYSKATYPDLAAALGNIADVGSPGEFVTPTNNIPAPFAITSSNTMYNVATNGSGTYVAGGSAGELRVSVDGTNWTAVPSKLIAAGSFSEIRYLNGKFIAINSATPCIVTSTDGYTWTQSEFASPNIPASVAYGNGKFVVVCAAGKIYYSSDAVTWTRASGMPTIVPGTVTDLKRVIWVSSLGLFITVGNNIVGSSSNGISWTSTFISGTWIDVAWGNNMLVTVSSSTTAIYYSPDGLSWTSSASGSASGFNQVVYANGYFVALSSGGATVCNSTDGITWSAQILPGSRTAYTVIYNPTNTTWYIGLIDGFYYASSSSNPNGSWIQYIDADCRSFFCAAIIANQLYLFGAGGAKIITGAGAGTWPLLAGAWGLPSWSNPRTNGKILASNGSNVYAMIGNTGQIMSSSDGLTWTGRTWNNANGYVSSSLCLNYAGGAFLAAFINGNIIHSTDGITWTLGYLSLAVNAYEFVYFNSLWLAAASTGLYKSSDRITWSQASSFAGSSYSMAVGSTLATPRVVAVGSSTVSFLNTTDGTTWNTITNPTSAIANRIIFANGLFVTLGNNGHISTSTDGVTFTNRTSPTASALWDGVWSSTLGLWVLVGASGTIITSSDGTTWTGRNPGDTRTMTSIVEVNGTFTVNSTTSFTVLTSTDGIIWNRAVAGAMSSVSAGFQQIIHDGTRYVAVGPAMSVASANGVTWSSATNNQMAALNSYRLVKANNVYFIFTQVGVFRSTNGTSWTPLRHQVVSAPGTSNGAGGVAYGNGIWVMAINQATAGNIGAVYKSTDSINWTHVLDIGTLATAAPAAGSFASDVVYANGNFIVGGQQGAIAVGTYTIYTSADGVTWTGRWTPNAFGPGYAIATNGTRAAFSGTGGNLYSDDGGVTWIRTAFGTAAANGMVYINGNWLISSGFGTTDFQSFYSTGVPTNLIDAGQGYLLTHVTNTSGIMGNNGIRTSTSTHYYREVMPLNIGTNTSNFKIIEERSGNILMIPISGTQYSYPTCLAEIPKYSYNTATTFWLPAGGSNGAATARVYAGN